MNILKREPKTKILAQPKKTSTTKIVTPILTVTKAGAIQGTVTWHHIHCAKRLLQFSFLKWRNWDTVELSWWLRRSSLPAMQENWVWSLGQEDPLEKEMATHFSILAWRIPWMEEPGGPQPMGSQSRTRLSELARAQHQWRGRWWRWWDDDDTTWH